MHRPEIYRKLALFLIGMGTFMGFNVLLTTIFLPFQSTSVIVFSIFEGFLIFVPTVIALASMAVLRQKISMAALGIAVAIFARYLTSGPIHFGPALNQFVLELLFLALGFKIRSCSAKN